MEPTIRHGALPRVVKIVAPLLAGLVVLLLLSPAHGVDTLPPQCFSVVGYDVPCGEGLAVAAGAATAAVVGLALWLRDRHR
jgi:hypothetical protein